MVSCAKGEEAVRGSIVVGLFFFLSQTHAEDTEFVGDEPAKEPVEVAGVVQHADGLARAQRRESLGVAKQPQLHVGPAAGDAARRRRNISNQPTKDTAASQNALLGEADKHGPVKKDHLGVDLAVQLAKGRARGKRGTETWGTEDDDTNKQKKKGEKQTLRLTGHSTRLKSWIKLTTRPLNTKTTAQNTSSGLARSHIHRRSGCSATGDIF